MKQSTILLKNIEILCLNTKNIVRKEIVLIKTIVWTRYKAELHSQIEIEEIRNVYKINKHGVVLGKDLAIDSAEVAERYPDSKIFPKFIKSSRNLFILSAST